MSFKTWKAKYYPVPSSEATGSDLEALDHAILKWSGLTPKILAEHGLSTENGALFCHSQGVFEIETSTCALCERRNDCHTCPILLVAGCSCSGSNIAEPHKKRGDDVFGPFCDQGNPVPMQKHLAKTRELLIANAKATA